MKPPESSPPLNSGSDRRVRQLLSPFDAAAADSRRLVNRAAHRFDSGGLEHEVVRYLWLGPVGGNDWFRVGIFATLNGDEPEGAYALARLLTDLEREPLLGRGYALYLYPLCNPTGYQDGARLSRAGHALNRLFWTNSEAPEVRFLEGELWMHGFHGIINLRSDADAVGLYGFASGAVISNSLLEPALKVAEGFLPRDFQRAQAGFLGRRGMVYPDLYDSKDSALRAVPGIQHPPFEITLATPRKTSVYLQVEALLATVTTILAEFRYLQAVGQNI